MNLKQTIRRILKEQGEQHKEEVQKKLNLVIKMIHILYNNVSFIEQSTFNGKPHLRIYFNSDDTAANIESWFDEKIYRDIKELTSGNIIVCPYWAANWDTRKKEADVYITTELLRYDNLGNVINESSKSIRRILSEELNNYEIFNPRNPLYLDAWLEIGDEDEETYEEYGIDRIQSIIDEVKELEFPLRIYRGISTADIKGEHNLVSHSEYDNLSWSTSRYVAEGFGNVVYTGIVENMDDINLEYTIYRRVLHKPLYEDEIIMKDNRLIKKLKRFR